MTPAGRRQGSRSRTEARQLALKFPLSSRLRFDDFVAGDNAELVRRLERLDEEQGFRGYFLHGAPGTGRTHLLQAACHRHGQRGAIYLPLSDPDVKPGLLEGLEALFLVALDDVDAWIGDADAEVALLALYQALQQAGGRLLVSAATPAGGLRFCYPDLASRLRGLAAYGLRELGDADKALLLQRRARGRGLELSGAVLDFWMSRSARDLPVLLAQLDRLDEAAMAEQRRVTVPLVKQVLGL